MVQDNEDVAILIDDTRCDLPDELKDYRLPEKTQRELDAEITEIDRKAKLKRASEKANA